jgi:PAS domain S-box-containing protein
MFAVCNIALLVAVVAWTARSLHRADRHRRRVEEALTASERRARQLTEASLDGIVVADDEGRIILFNPAAERTFGYTAAEVLGEPLTCLMPAEFHERHRAGVRRFVETREARLVGRTVQVAGRRKDGTQYPLELALGALEVGGRVQFIGTIRDVTERDHMRAAMIQSEKLASIGLLTAGVAHEINNPLAYVANNLAVLERDTRGVLAVLDAYEGARERFAAADPPTAARVRKLAEEIDLPYVRGNLDRLLGRTREGVERVTRLVQAMRGMARSGPPQMETIGITDLVDMSLEMVRSRLQRRAITVECDYTGAPKLRCATSQVSQVLLNLLVNALQAIEATGRPEGGRIRIASRPVGKDILIEVTDNGCGIPPQDLPHVFDPFFTTKAVGGGTGLGLSITHGIVTGHGGRLEVSSEPGKGSCFRVFLPLSDSGGAS